MKILKFWIFQNFTFFGRNSLFLAWFSDSSCFSASDALFFTRKYALGVNLGVRVFFANTGIESWRFLAIFQLLNFSFFKYVFEFFMALGHFWWYFRIPRDFLRRFHYFSAQQTPWAKQIITFSGHVNTAKARPYADGTRVSYELWLFPSCKRLLGRNDRQLRQGW